MAELTEKRRHAFELMRHPLNRAFFERVVRMLKDNGMYGWPDLGEVFTKDEIKLALEGKLP